MPHAARSPAALIGIASLALAACAGTLEQEGALTVVPYSIEPGGRIVVEVALDGRGPFRFAVDTAATGSFVFAGPREALGLEPEPGLSATVHGAVASGSFPVITIGRLEIGAVSWQAPRLIALPAGAAAAARIDGVLGTDFLRRYSIGFSVAERRLRLFPPDHLGAESYSGWASIRLEPVAFGNSEESLHFLEIAIGQGSVPALFDLGAGISVLNTPAARALRLAPTRQERAGEFAGALGAETIVARLGTQALRTGSVRWRDESFLIGDPPIFSTLEHAERPLAILGSGVFAQRDFIIDFAHGRLLVRQSMSELESSSPEAARTGSGPAVSPAVVSEQQPGP